MKQKDDASDSKEQLAEKMEEKITELVDEKVQARLDALEKRDRRARGEEPAKERRRHGGGTEEDVSSGVGQVPRADERPAEADW